MYSNVVPDQEPDETELEALLAAATQALKATEKAIMADDRESLGSHAREVREIYRDLIARRHDLPNSFADAVALQSSLDRLRALLRSLGEKV